MRALLQRVKRARVSVDGQVAGQIEHGLLVYLGVAVGDTPSIARKMAMKVANMRIFEDAAGKLNLSVQDVRGGVLVISNFTLLGDARKGRRPEFLSAARPELAENLYEHFVRELRALGATVACGVFRATMAIESVADGPVNIVVDMPPVLEGDAPGGKESEQTDSSE